MPRPRPFAAAPPDARRERITGALVLLSLLVLVLLVLGVLRGFVGGEPFG